MIQTTTVTSPPQATEKRIDWNPIEWKVKIFDTVSGKIVFERV